MTLRRFTMLAKNLLIQSAMAGWSDGGFCREAAAAGAAMVTLGGYNVDVATHRAAAKASRRRKEFLVPPRDLPSRIVDEASLAASGGALIAVNLRFSEISALDAICAGLHPPIDLVELNAHCRQPEFIAAGAGEALLLDPESLCQAVRTVSRRVPTIVKIRALHMSRDLASSLEDSGAWAIHLDLMKPGEARPDLKLLTTIRDWTEMPIIGNNSVVDQDSFIRMLDNGANMASMARALLDGMEPIQLILGSEACWEAMKRSCPFDGSIFRVGRGRGEQS